ncbi:MAG: 30S ribosomal protein S20 [Candidatus Liptonbacteria bacterium RIFCSPHIGHO2_01_FULL_57_28]|uniref:Small ribosomal subunit protein bS20 n=1 Tax=Candidatus Liptonbacteria bacterium RIFCSPHIGHO2_01_FULL_57_28 TaxID=1798647 RepID=A0A1G2CDN3_9BACT|nr:MAG: 30S ribosomal protein S20 [Candidatus Liptonbacteria bacterium RIFCSPHIGHO2_01_FULL_57_28]
MPITSSAKKALRQNKRRRVMNLSRQDAYKSAIKEYRALVGAKKMDEAAVALKKAFKNLDKAAKGKTIKKNKASRLKSRLAKLVKKA